MAEKFSALEETLVEHRADNFGEVLPHLLMADFCRVVCRANCSPNWVDDFLSELEESFSEESDDEVSNLIAVSFIENLPIPSDNHAVTKILPPKLKRQYVVVFGT